MSKNEFTCDCCVVHQEAVDEANKNMLSQETFDNLSAFFKAISDSTRTRILWALDKNELCVCDLANILSMTKSAVSHQLSTLRKANLVKCRKDGKTVYYSLADNHVKEMLETGLEHISE